jgi:hypothetical protein
MSSRDAIRRRRANDPLNLFLAYLAEIEQTLLNRNWIQLNTLLRKRRSSHLPREVREELVFLTRSPRESLRAPVRFLRFQHRMTQLALGGETLPTAQTELPLEAGFDPSARLVADGPRRVAAGEIRFETAEGDEER